jgi:D-alanine-D-alanine ligase
VTARRVLALVCGGRSVEHEVSLASARTLAGGADPERYELVPVLVDHDGRWYTGDVDRMLADDKDAAAVGTRVFPPADPVDRVLRTADGEAASPPLDVVFPIVHGTGGEDGRLQGLLESADLAYVGAGVQASSLCFDKDVSKRVLAQAGIDVTPWLTVDQATWRSEPDAVLDRAARLGLPAFVKPARGGSSVGVSRAESRDELAVGLEVALELDTHALVEQAIDAREIECAVLGNADPASAAPAEIVSGKAFYDYEAKYHDVGSVVHVPAPLDESEAADARRVAVEAYRTLGIEGMARVDLLMERVTGRYYVNEANTLPGFTSISVYPQAWAHEGVALPELIDRLVELGVERAETQRALRYRWRPGD